MMTTFRQALAAKGVSQIPFRPTSAAGRLSRSRGVRCSSELSRVATLPRRRPSERGNERDAKVLTERYRLPWGEMELRPVQAWALGEMAVRGGLLGPMRVGAGKTLVSFLAPLALDSKRCALIVPAKLRDKTRRDFATLALHWRSPCIPMILSYEELGRSKGAAILETCRPDLVVCDEVHRLKNRRAAVTRRVCRYLDAHPETRFVALSGTITRRSLRDFYHLAAFALKEGSPLPRDWSSVVEWSLAVDAELGPTERRLRPGALEKLYDDANRRCAAQGDEITAARNAVQCRLVTTEGVVSTQGDVGCSASISLSPLKVEPGRVARQKLRELRTEWELDGIVCAEAVQLWRLARELGEGFYYALEPPPPREWVRARRAWASECRDCIAHNRRDLDSEMVVAAAVARGEYKGTVLERAYVAWRAIKDSYDPQQHRVTRWVDEEPTRAATLWLKDHGGVVFCAHVAFGELLAERTGLPYFGQLGVCDGRPIEDADGQPCVASLRANMEGRNLQAWSRALVVGAPGGGLEWQQLIGRMHRDGQKADEVEIFYLSSVEEHEDAVERAIEDARYLRDVTGEEQKLLIADRSGSCR